MHLRRPLRKNGLLSDADMVVMVSVVGVGCSCCLSMIVSTTSYGIMVDFLGVRSWTEGGRWRAGFFWLLAKEAGGSFSGKEKKRGLLLLAAESVQKTPRTTSQSNSFRTLPSLRYFRLPIPMTSSYNAGCLPHAKFTQYYAIKFSVLSHRCYWYILVVGSTTNIYTSSCLQSCRRSFKIAKRE